MMNIVIGVVILCGISAVACFLLWRNSKKGKKLDEACTCSDFSCDSPEPKSQTHKSVVD